MGKEQIIFRDTKERVDQRDRREGSSSKNFSFKNREVQVKKNISKKDSDKKERYKKHARIEKLHERKVENEKSAVLKKMQRGNMDWKEKRAKIMQERRADNKQKEMEGEEWEDVDEHEKEVFATTGYFDVPDSEALISAADQKLLEQMGQKNTPSAGGVKVDANGHINFADLVMQKLQTGDYIDGDASNMSELQAASSTLDPKVIAAYKKVGIVMRSYKSGKLPKAFKIIPQT